MLLPGKRARTAALGRRPLRLSRTGWGDLPEGQDLCHPSALCGTACGWGKWQGVPGGWGFGCRGATIRAAYRDSSTRPSRCAVRMSLRIFVIHPLYVGPQVDWVSGRGFLRGSIRVQGVNHTPPEPSSELDCRLLVPLLAKNWKGRGAVDFSRFETYLSLPQ